MICNECETVAHCAKHGCIPKQPAPVLCCGQYETCTQACTPRGEFLAKRDAQAAQPAPVQEPVAWCTKSDLENMAKGFSQDVPARSMRVPQLYPKEGAVLLYTTPPAAPVQLVQPVAWMQVAEGGEA